jgi:hypothetical protein
LQYPKIKHIVSDAQSLDPLKDVGDLNSEKLQWSGLVPFIA